ncbi:unnamed protein product [Moneuplotes crassus]|uniref:Secreted protein n=1 Tax=Euplotes crassus TaxID=5936 RepID=A0AAD2D453_EUPCR|nr:unnamed protein product [Moneuplotes crassus]
MLDWHRFFDIVHFISLLVIAHDTMGSRAKDILPHSRLLILSTNLGLCSILRGAQRTRGKPFLFSGFCSTTPTTLTALLCSDICRLRIPAVTCTGLQLRLEAFFSNSRFPYFSPYNLSSRVYRLPSYICGLERAFRARPCISLCLNSQKYLTDMKLNSGYRN